jgi:hypothetical protein
MKRLIAIDPDMLQWSLTIPASERLRQANAAFRLYHAIHKPYAIPFSRGFDSLEEFFAFEKEQDVRD